jgi:betaine reductase
MVSRVLAGELVVNSPKMVITGARNFLAHAPGLVRYGSKPTREIAANPEMAGKITGHLRTYEQAASYLPNRAYLGGVKPDELAKVPRPWYPLEGPAVRRNPYGEIMPEDEFYGVMKSLDAFDLMWLEESFAATQREKLLKHPSFTAKDVKNLEKGSPIGKIQDQVKPGSGNLPLYLRDGTLIGVMNRAHDLDVSLFADVLLENLACKATAVMATRTLLTDAHCDVATIPYIVNSGEEAVGDRYQRGGGNLAKAVGESCGLMNASGVDVKAFCCGPNHAIVIAAGPSLPAEKK